jgi:hypothetical protein
MRFAVAWTAACRPTDVGGLGIVDLKLAGIALQSRWLWLQLTNRDRAWSALEIQVEPDVEAFFRASVLAVLGDGASIHFWADSWLDEKSIECFAPSLLALVPPRFTKSRTVAPALTDDRWTRDVTGVPGTAALVELNRLGERLADVQLQPGISDTFRWRWTADGNYSARSAYRALHVGSTKLNGAKLIWNCWAPLKVKFFLWPAFHRRLWTADRRLRHGLQADTVCNLCDQADETSVTHALPILFLSTGVVGNSEALGFRGNFPGAGHVVLGLVATPTTAAPNLQEEGVRPPVRSDCLAHLEGKECPGFQRCGSWR